MLTRSWPTRPLFHPSDLESVRRDLFRFFDGEEPNAFPPANLSQDDERFFVRAEVPGLKPEDIAISAEKNRLTISGKRVIAREGEQGRYHRREREDGTFTRTFALPQPFDADKVEASYVDGILTVTLPKAAEAKPRKIAVNGGGS
jgi:HSP20 family protein